MNPTGTRGRGRPPRLSNQNVRPSPPSSPGNSISMMGMRPSSLMSMPTTMNQPIRSIPSVPNFDADILANLPKAQQAAMKNLVDQFRSKAITIQEFMSTSRGLLGEQLFAVLAQGMNRAAASRNITGNALTGIIPPIPSQGTRPVGRPPLSSNIEEDNYLFDVTTGGLQDVIQYAGIDLKAESEIITREHESLGQQHYHPSFIDSRLPGEYLFNGIRLRALLQSIAIEEGSSLEINEEAIQVMAIGLRERMANILADLVEASKHRCDAYFRMPFKIKIENDPKKQIWLVDKLLSHDDTKFEAELKTNKDDDHQTIGSGGMDAPLPTSAAGMIGTSSAGRSSKKTKISAGEEAIVKTKLANTTALTVLGLQQKSWMTQAAATAAYNLQQHTQVEMDSSHPDEEMTDSSYQMVNVPLHFSQAPTMTPQTDRELQSVIKNRSIAIRDLIWLAEQDRYIRTKHSILQILYDLQQ